MKQTPNKKKQNGEVFTPQKLAKFLANRMLQYININHPTKIYDPSCGDGALLYALANELLDSDAAPFSIFGSDKDETYLSQATDLISIHFPAIQSQFEVKDFIEQKVDSLFHSTEKYDAIIGNPPYVRTQTLGNEKSQLIAKLYGLSGRVDLYYPFLINMTDSLENGGILGVITSNRYLTTKSGEAIRKYLLNHYDILEIIDLGDTKLFDAAVLPAIFIGRKNNSNNKNDIGNFLKIYENLNNTQVTCTKESVYDILESNENGCYSIGSTSYNYSVGKFLRPLVSTDIWQMNTPKEQSLIDVIQANTAFYVGERFKVRVGVKSCADEVFINGSKNNLEDDLEDIFYRNLISQENITPWIISENLLSVIYPHYDNNGIKDVLNIDNYPKAKAFFEKHSERLRKRTYLMKSNRKWYEYWVPQNATLWKYPKLVFPDISVEPRFAIDTTGAIVNGNCYWIYASNEEDLNLLYLIEGVANSNLIVQYHDLCFNNKLYSGRRRYLTQYVEKYPVPNPNSIYSQRIVEIAKKLHSNISEKEHSEMILELNESVIKAFNVI